MVDNNNKDTSVKVAVRIRPLNSNELAEDSSVCVNILPGEPRIVAGSDIYFTFDYVFGMDSQQEDIYEDCVVDLVHSAFEGFNATILAYGQTGSGKTWTMGSSSDLPVNQYTQGIIPRVIRHIFDLVEEKENENPNSSYKIQVQFLEIYGEDIKDLLDHTKTSKVVIRETPSGDVFVSGAREEAVSSMQQMMRALEDGTKHRITSATRMNLSSSRSHAIFTIMIEHTIHGSAITDPMATIDDENLPPNPSVILQIKPEIRKCKFHFVDLAGSERVKKTGAQGQQLKEGIDINKGLLALGNVISALGDESKRGKYHVPYRDSKLTRILQDSLGGNSKTLMICCVSPAYSNFYETINALRYANRARNIKNKPIVNRDPTVVMLEELKLMNSKLAFEVLSARIDCGYIPKENKFTNEFLESLSKNKDAPMSSFSSIISNNNNNINNNNSCRGSRKAPNSNNATVNQHSNKSNAIAPKSSDISNDIRQSISDDEIQRLSIQLKQYKNQLQDLSDRLVIMQSEKDYYEMKFKDINKIDDSNNDNNYDSDKRESIDYISKYIKEIENLKNQLTIEKMNNSAKSSKIIPIKKLLKITNDEVDLTESDDENLLDSEWTSNITMAIEEAKKFLTIETNKLQNVAKEDGNVDSSNNKPVDSKEEVDIENPIDGSSSTEENLIKYQKKQVNLQNEILLINESIKIKENLISQLEKSQKQYENMKYFYENKLNICLNEIKQKSIERDLLVKELESIEKNENEKENELKNLLDIKENEIKKLKEKSNKLNNLTNIQNKYYEQLKMLENNITDMKKQKIIIFKELKNEKKLHLMQLKEKTLEINSLKKQLLNNFNELNKMKTNIKFSSTIIKPSIDNKNKNSKNTVNKKLKKDNSIRILSDNEIKLKKLINKYISNIFNNKVISDNIIKNYNIKLNLIKEKNNLENMSSNVSNSKDSNISNENDISDNISKINSQINLKTKQIEELEQSLQSNELNLPNNNNEVIDILIKNYANNYVTIYELVNILYDLLYENYYNYQSTLVLNKELKSNELLLYNRIDALENELQSTKYNYDNDVTKLGEIYEEKLHSLFQYCSLGELVIQESGIVNNTTNILSSTSNDNNSSTNEITTDVNSNLFITPMKSSDNIILPRLSSSKSDRLARTSNFYMKFNDNDMNNETKLRTLLSLCNEQVNELKQQLNQEKVNNNDLNTQINELILSNSNFSKQLNEKNDNIKFLEEERSFFKDIVNDLRLTIQQLDNNKGYRIIQQIREKNKGKSFYDSNHILGDSDDDLIDESHEDDDSESIDDNIINKYNEIEQEILKNKTISMNSSISTANHAINSKSGAVVYDRLTNPSNFTGAQKKVFEQDLPKKREKVQLMKTNSLLSIPSNSMPFNNLTRKELPNPLISNNNSFNINTMTNPKSALKSGNKPLSNIIRDAIRKSRGDTNINAPTSASNSPSKINLENNVVSLNEISLDYHDDINQESNSIYNDLTSRSVDS